MKPIREFSQGKLLEKYKTETGQDSLGICMRLSFKWLACKFFGGVFAYDETNVKKASEKLDAYTREAIDMLRGSDFKGDERFSASKYVVTDLLQIKAYINKWGIKVTDHVKTVYRNIHCAEAVRAPLHQYVKSRRGTVAQADMALMITFYMLFTKQRIQAALPKIAFAGPDSRKLMAGHAVAYFGGDNTFFDPNYGHFRVEKSSCLDAAQEIETFLAARYNLTGDPNDRTVLRIASTG